MTPTPSLAQYLARAEGRAFERRLQQARYHAGIDLGTTHSSVTLVDALALLRGDTDEAVRVLPVRQHTSRGTQESPLLPSVVAEVEPGDWWVGLGAREARSRGLLRGRQIFYSTKLEMGLGREPFYPLAIPVGAERVTVTVTWVEQDVYHAEHPTAEVYLFTEGCTEVVQKESVVLDLDPGPPQAVRILFYGGEVECRVVRAMADGQVAEE